MYMTLRLLATILPLLLASGTACAQDYPAKPIRLIVSSAAGGSTDTIARLVGQKLTPALGQSVIIENRPGAGGNIGDNFVAKSVPDGYTLLVAGGSLAVNVTLYRKLPFDAVKDLVPVAHLCVVTGMTVVHPSLPARSIGDLITLARARPGQINYASASSGSITHLAGELFKYMSKIEIVHIPYRGSGPALSDLLGGQVSLMFPNMPGTIQHVQAGRLRALAVNSAKRSPLLPNVPTVAETVPGFEAGTWFGVLAPASTPAAIVARLNGEIVKTLATPDFAERLKAEGAIAVGGSPEQFGAFIRSEIEKWGRIVRDSVTRID